MVIEGIVLCLVVICITIMVLYTKKLENRNTDKQLDRLFNDYEIKEILQKYRDK